MKLDGLRLLVFCAGALVLAAAGCQALAPVSAAHLQLSGGSATVLPSGTAIAAPAGFIVDPGRVHVLDAAGTMPVAGTVVGTQSAPVDGAFVYFTDTSDNYYVARTATSGYSLVVAPTDASGSFQTPGVFPAGTPVFCNALLPQNRRLEGFGIAGSGASISVTPGFTYAIEFLRDEASASGAVFSTLVGQQDVQQTLLAQGAHADQLIAQGVLAPPSDAAGDLIIGNGTQLSARYVASAFAADGATAQAWNAVLPRPIYAMTTLAGDFLLRDNDAGGSGGQSNGKSVPATSVGMHYPAGVAQGSDGGVYIAELGADRLKEVLNGQMSLTAGYFVGDPTVIPPVVSPDGTPIGTSLQLGAIQAVAADPLSGNLAMTFYEAEQQFGFVGYLCLKGGTYFGRTMNADTFYRLGGDAQGDDGYQNGSVVPGVSSPVLFKSPTGLTFDDGGNLYVADRRNDRIRRIDGTTGVVTTVLGDGWPVLAVTDSPSASDTPEATVSVADLGGYATASYSVVAAKIPDLGRFVDAPVAGPGSGLTASFCRPLQLAWRRLGSEQELYIYDSYNDAIRKAVTYDGNFADAAVTTVAGMQHAVVQAPLLAAASWQSSAAGLAPVGATASVPYTVWTGTQGPGGDGPGTQVAFTFARYDPTNIAQAQLLTGGLAIDPSPGYDSLYFVDTDNAAIDRFDLATGLVTTIARNDPSGNSLINGDSMRCLLSFELAGMTVLSDHSLVVADKVNNVVRQIHLEHGL